MLRIFLKFVLLYLILCLKISAQVPPKITHTKFKPIAQCDDYIIHSYFHLCYNQFHRQSLFAIHTLTKASINASSVRTNDYREDPLLQNSPNANDYRYSGFDRGHLVPAADMKINIKAMSESFYMSNMAAQRPGFNRGVWLRIENDIRKRVLKNGSAIIVTAPLLNTSLSRLNSDISIARFFYKIAYWPQHNKMISYLIENIKQSGVSLNKFVVSVDYIEGLTGIDFFSQLPDVLENKLEARVDFN